MAKIPDYNESAVKAAWESYIGGHRPVPEYIDGVRPMITASWRRSQKTAYSQKRLKRMKPRELKELYEENHLLMEIAFPYLKDFFQTFKNSHHQISLADKHGYQLRKIGNLSLNSPPDTFDPFQDGLDFSEASAGTNGIGTSLVEKKPIMIFGAEHYHPYYHEMACYAAPIYDPTGALLGCINITGPLSYWEPMIMTVLQTAVSGIEKQFELTQRNNMLHTLLESLDQGVLMLDHENRIQFCNPAASQLLKTGNTSLQGKSIFEILQRDSFPPAIRSLRTPLTSEDCTLYNTNQERIDLSLTVRPADPSAHGTESTLLLFYSQSYVHQLTTKLAGFSAVYRFDAIVGTSDSIRSVIDMGKMTANRAAPLLLFGEKGTGKRMLAQAIHSAGKGPKKPFVELNCGSIPASRLRAELFGSQNPATGTDIPGKLELARGGTLYLDDIGALPVDLQGDLAALLKAQSNAPSFRLIASSCDSLFPQIQKGAFREDLYYLLNALTITIPPLRERSEDILAIAEKIASETAGQPRTIPEDTAAILTAYPWPGNARELEECIRLAVRHANGAAPSPDDLPSEIVNHYYTAQAVRSGMVPVHAPEQSAKSSVPASAADAREYYLLTEALKQAHGNSSQAAKSLSLPVSTFYRKLSKLQIRAKDFRD